MALSSFKLAAGPFPARLGEKDLPIKRPVIISAKTPRALQNIIRDVTPHHDLRTRLHFSCTKRGNAFQKLVKSEERKKPEAPLDLGVSRRDMMIYLIAGTLSGPTEPVEARVVKPEIRRKIREKLEKLREKAGLLKLKNENGMKEPSAQSSKKEKNLSPVLPQLPFPNPKEPVVEAILP